MLRGALMPYTVDLGERLGEGLIDKRTPRDANKQVAPRILPTGTRSAAGGNPPSRHSARPS